MRTRLNHRPARDIIPPCGGQENAIQKGGIRQSQGTPERLPNFNELASKLLWKKVAITQNGKPIKVPYIQAL